MRDGIIEQLPKALAKDQFVVVVGPPDSNGQNDLKSLIDELNRGGKWIRGEFRNQLEKTCVPNKAAVVLTMVRTSHGALANVRNAATAVGACCPNQALTIGETKKVLSFLAEVRREVSVLPGHHNGNGVHPVEREVEALPTSSSPSEPVGEKFATEPPPEEIVDDSKEVTAALAVIERFHEISKETEVAVMMVGDRLREVTAERDEFQQKLGARSEEIAQLRSQLETAQKAAEKVSTENAVLLQKNGNLESEVRQLRTTLDQFDSLIKGVRQK